MTNTFLYDRYVGCKGCRGVMMINYIYLIMQQLVGRVGRVDRLGLFNNEEMSKYYSLGSILKGVDQTSLTRFWRFPRFKKPNFSI
jgi:hypothetical protein